MSFFSKRPSGKSIAAFLFMPQFRLMLPQFSMNQSIFVSILATMYVQAGLLPWGHPATNPGMRTKYRVRDLIGEAWVALRTSENPTPYQYAMFWSTMLMLAFLTLLIVTVIATLIFGAAAYAAPITPLFEDPTPGAIGDPANKDLAEQLLDSVVRVGSIGQGTPGQVALGPLLALYSWAVLVVAAFMVFWAVVSIVAETARTGQLGGNRHNMLWSPIRLVFAIGLLIPLGYGFNSGQYIVLKIAHWGSSLGTNGWVTYVDALVQDKSLIAEATADAPYDEVQQFLQILVCKHAYQKQLDVYGLGGSSNYAITRTQSVEEGTGEVTFTWGNKLDPEMCGYIRLQSPNATDLGAGGIATPSIKALRLVHNTAFMAMEGDLDTLAEKIVSKQIPIEPGWDDKFPPITPVQPAINTYMTTLQAGIDAAYTQMNNAIKNGPLIQEIKAAGWPGAGIWYHKIAQMNEAMQDSASSLPQVYSQAQNYSRMSVGMAGTNTFKNTKDMIEKFNEWWVANADQISSGRAGETGAERSYASAASGIPDVNIESNVMEYINKFFGLGPRYFLFDIDPKGDQVYALGRLAAIGDSIIDKSLMAYGGMVGVSAAAALVPSLTGGVGTATGALIALMSGPVGALLGMIGAAGFSAGAILLWYVPLIPFIRVFFAAMAWLYAVVEAVAMMPIFALMHLQTDGEGLPGGAGKTGYYMLLSLLFRPILIVIGFVFALLIFTTAVNILHETMIATIDSIAGRTQISILSQMAYTVIYVGMVYLMANSTFKTIDTLPNAVMKWLGGPQEGSSDESGELVGFGLAGAGFAMQSVSNLAGNMSDSAREYAKGKKPKPSGLDKDE